MFTYVVIVANQLQSTTQKIIMLLKGSARILGDFKMSSSLYMTNKSRNKCCIVTFVCIFYGDLAALQYGRRSYFRAQGLSRPSSSRPNFFVLVLPRPIMLQETIQAEMSMARAGQTSKFKPRFHDFAYQDFIDLECRNIDAHICSDI